MTKTLFVCLLLVTLFACCVHAQAYDLDFDTFDDLFPEENDDNNVLQVGTNFERGTTMDMTQCRNKLNGGVVYQCNNEYIEPDRLSNLKCNKKAVKTGKCFKSCPKGKSNEKTYLNIENLTCDYARSACPSGGWNAGLGKCVTGPSQTSCIRPYSYSNGQCTKTADRICPVGTSADGSLCRDSRKRLVGKVNSCTDGAKVVDAKCVLPGQILKCPIGFRISNGNCIDDPVCTPGRNCVRSVALEFF